MYLKLLQREQCKKTAGATGDLIGNEIIGDKIINTSSQNVLKTNTISQTKDVIPREIYTSPEKRQQTINIIRLI